MSATVIAVTVAVVLGGALLAMVAASCGVVPEWVGPLGLRGVQVMTPIALLVTVALVMSRSR